MECISLNNMGIKIDSQQDGQWVDLFKYKNEIGNIDFKNSLIYRVFELCNINFIKHENNRKYISPIFLCLMIQRNLNDKVVSLDGINIQNEFKHMFGEHWNDIYEIYDMIHSKGITNSSIAVFSAMQYYYVAERNAFLYDKELCKEFANMFIHKLNMLNRANSKSKVSLRSYQAINICSVLADRNKQQIDWGEIWQQK